MQHLNASFAGAVLNFETRLLWNFSKPALDSFSMANASLLRKGPFVLDHLELSLDV